MFAKCIFVCFNVQDEVARIAICENPAWVPLTSMFGLLGCSIPTSLKGCILETLAAFAKSPEITASMWQSLETSQILQTVKPVGQAFQEGGLLAELEEIESRVEAYPETRAFMKLLANLTSYPVPGNLGAGYRVPGFEPYLDFLRDSVLMKFKTRAYLDPNEKWEVASGVLQILVKLLEQFEPSAENMSEEYIEISARERVTAAKSPGYTLMLHMLNETSMLKMILSIINEGSVLLDQVTAFSGQKDDIEMSALLSLKLVEITLEKQREFTHCLRQQNSSVLVTSLDQLLLGVGVRSRSSDSIAHIASYITHTHTSPEITLVAVKILYLVCQAPVAQPEIYNRLTTNKERAQQLLVGFVDHLDTAELEDSVRRPYENTGFLEEVANKSQIQAAIRQNIVRFLLYCLKLRSPNISHYLLGFHGRKPIQELTLQDPGILGTPRTCLHSILDILKQGLDTPRGSTAIDDTPRLAELCFQLIYALCQNKETSEASIRYLRTSHNYFYSHLVHLPLKVPTCSSGEDVSANTLCKLNQQSWLLKSIATELRLTAQTRQRSHVQQLLSLLLAERSEFYPQRSSESEIDPLEDERTRSAMGSKDTRKITEILHSIDFTHGVPPPLQSVLNYFEPAATEAVITSCDESNGDSPFVYTNLRKLYSLLLSELEVVQGPATTAQRNHLVQEVKDIMNYTLERNRYREGLYSKQQAFESWRQLVEVILASCPLELLNREMKQAVIFDLMRDLLAKMSDESSSPELVAPVSGVVLTLMAHLRQSTLPSGEALETLPSRGTMTSAWRDHGVAKELGLPAQPLHTILQSVIKALLKTSGSYQRVRANLYGSLLYYLQIGQRKDESRESVSKADAALQKKNYEIILSFGDAFMDIACRDSCDGHDVTRMLACAMIDSIVAIDWRHRWMQFLHTKGYLGHLVESLLQEDENLQDVLRPSPEPLRSLYVYESKMGLLTRLAQSAEGANALLNTGVMSRLSECRFIDLRPSGPASHFHTHRHSSYSPDRMMTTMTSSGDIFVPSIMERYQQLLIPALRMSLSLLTSLGQEHHDASVQILHFIIAHSEVFSDVLQEQTDRVTVSSLHELYLVSGIICKSGVTEYAFSDEETRFEDMMQLKAPLSRIQRLMLALLPKYSVRENWDRIVREILDVEMDEREAAFKALQYNVSALEAYQTLQQIYGNLITYCKNVVVSGVPGSSYCQVLFAPVLTDIYTRDSLFTKRGSLGSSVTGNQPSLAIIVRNLKICCEKVVNCVEANKQANLRLNNIDELSMDELKQLGLQYSSSVERMSTQQKQQLAFKCLREVVRYRSDELDMYIYIIENSLFILCKHLEYYYLHCVPSDREVSTLQSSLTGRTKPRGLQDYSPYDEGQSSDRGQLQSKFHSGVTRADIEK
ncbi:nuclear pore complex Nup205-like, partial [Paramuricea clavata]